MKTYAESHVTLRSDAPLTIHRTPREQSATLHLGLTGSRISQWYFTIRYKKRSKETHILCHSSRSSTYYIRLRSPKLSVIYRAKFYVISSYTQTQTRPVNKTFLLSMIRGLQMYHLYFQC